MEGLRRFVEHVRKLKAKSDDEVDGFEEEFKVRSRAGGPMDPFRGRRPSKPSRLVENEGSDG